MNEIAPERDSRPGPTGSALDPSRERIVEMGMAAVEWVAGYLESIRDLPVTPQISSAQLRSLLAEPLPAEGREFGRLLEVFATVIAPGTRHHGHRRFFGYVSAPGTAVAAQLHVHPQTVRYRLRQLDRLFGPALRDPRTRS